ncbi:hypothetical protein GJU40_15105 [Bacillus lacus]|uniref:Uncharacterized protein n=1 Tax=Metabacillus lacus TaxID=1983721 RepID=A0A7X2J126_9BACI|nr:hypothetical protein [Metabacillus lacus]MRX73470.1 hypothetical protein [Metabacillus lacus]
MLEHNVIEVEAGKTIDVPVYIKIPNGKEGPKPTELTFTAVSETNTSLKASITHRAGPGKGK